MDKTPKWDYSVYHDEERASVVRDRYTDEYSQELLKKYDDTIMTETSVLSRELEAAANYILYGKRKDSDKNAVQEKKIQMESKYKTYAKKSVQSLDMLLEDPARASSVENSAQPIKKSTYTNPKPKINREVDGTIPGMMELWEQIDLISGMVKSYAANEKDQTKALNLYKLKHLLIELRQSQYSLKESYKPTLRLMKGVQPKRSLIKWGDDTGYLIECEDGPTMEKAVGDILRKNPDLKAEDNYIVVSENSIDYTDKNHIYSILENYSLLKEFVWEELEADVRYELDYLEFLVDRTELSEVRKFILEKKIDKTSNFQISEEIHKNFGIFYNPNYISTIWKQEICGKIANKAALLQKEEVYINQKDKWRVCAHCKEELLLDKANFLFDRVENDYKTTCKKCGREEIMKKKKEKESNG